jgi:hypothetical protein
VGLLSVLTLLGALGARVEVSRIWAESVAAARTAALRQQAALFDAAWSKAMKAIAERDAAIQALIDANADLRHRLERGRAACQPPAIGACRPAVLSTDAPSHDPCRRKS